MRPFSTFTKPMRTTEQMEEIDVETILQRAREKFPGERPRIISDNSPRFIAKDNVRIYQTVRLRVEQRQRIHWPTG